MDSSTFILQSNASSYKVGRLLGKGTFGDVYEATCQTTGTQYAVKLIGKCLLRETQAQTRLRKEVQIQHRLRHPNIVELHDFSEDQNCVYLVTDLCSRGELLSQIRHRGSLPEVEVRNYFRQLVLGIQYLHQQAVMHRDIKLANILLCEDGGLKIADFGLAAALENADSERTTVCGTPNYLSPEIVLNQPYTYASDLWSLGVALFTMLVGSPPFQGKQVSETLSKVKQGIYEVPSYLSTEARSLIAGLLQLKPQNRLSISEILQHPFLASGHTKENDSKPPLSRDLSHSSAEHTNTDQLRGLQTKNHQTTSGVPQGHCQQDREAMPPPPPRAANLSARPVGVQTAVCDKSAAQCNQSAAPVTQSFHEENLLESRRPTAVLTGPDNELRPESSCSPQPEPHKRHQKDQVEDEHAVHAGQRASWRAGCGLLQEAPQLATCLSLDGSREVLGSGLGLQARGGLAARGGSSSEPPHMPPTSRLAPRCSSTSFGHLAILRGGDVEVRSAVSGIKVVVSGGGKRIRLERAGKAAKEFDSPDYPEGLKPFLAVAAGYAQLVASSTPRVVLDSPEARIVLSEAEEVTVSFKGGPAAEVVRVKLALGPKTGELELAGGGAPFAVDAEPILKGRCAADAGLPERLVREAILFAARAADKCRRVEERFLAQAAAAGREALYPVVSRMRRGARA